MRINFFEEVSLDPKETSKATLLDFPSTVFLAAHSFDQFAGLREWLRRINPKLEAGYWHVAEESRWLSPFSYPSEIENVLNETERIKEKGLKILLDLELPFKNPMNFMFMRPFSAENKKKLKNLFYSLKNNNIEILTAEWTPVGKSSDIAMNIFGTSYSIRRHPHKRIRMYYSSLLYPIKADDDRTLKHKKKLEIRMKNFLINEREKYGGLVQIGLGITAQGVYNEPLIKPEDLERDLEFARSAGFDTATIFRVGGLNEDYMKVIKKYVS